MMQLVSCVKHLSCLSGPLHLMKKMFGVIVYSCRLGLIHCIVSTPLPKYSTESVIIALCFASCSKELCWLYVHNQMRQRCAAIAASMVVLYGL